MSQTIPTPLPREVPGSIDATLELLDRGRYIADRSLATTLYLALQMGRPLFLEGEAGVGKTEIGKVLSETLGPASCPATVLRRLGCRFGCL